MHFDRYIHLFNHHHNQDIRCRIYPLGPFLQSKTPSSSLVLIYVCMYICICMYIHMNISVLFHLSKYLIVELLGHKRLIYMFSIIWNFQHPQVVFHLVLNRISPITNEYVSYVYLQSLLPLWNESLTSPENFYLFTEL